MEKAIGIDGQGIAGAYSLARRDAAGDGDIAHQLLHFGSIHAINHIRHLRAKDLWETMWNI
ncbi:hypothetical protein Sbs19_16210 [Sphingobium sp. BS19]|nr:hypothetical protein Sbs19_16210 [Sphingobium sp. BS19]